MTALDRHRETLAAMEAFQHEMRRLDCEHHMLTKWLGAAIDYTKVELKRAERAVLNNPGCKAAQ